MIKRIFNRYLLRILGNDVFPGSQKYWETRYNSGDNSGRGSYGKLADFKAEIVNNFIKEKKIKKVIEFGSGDGNQLSLFKIPEYIGLDVSKNAIQRCLIKMRKDKNKSLFLYDPLCFIDNGSTFNAELVLSLDVIFHLVEDEIFELHMNHVFNSSKKFVIIYSSNYNSSQQYHVKHRKFTEWVKKNRQNWKLIEKINNKYSSINFANFYIFQKH